MWTPTEIYYVKNGGNDASAGTAMSTAWATIDKALVFASGAVAAGSVIILSRDCSLTPGTFTITVTPTINLPILVTLWARPSVAITANFTKDSSTVSSVSGISLVDKDDAGRFIVCPDGREYQIEKVTSSSAFILNTDYIGDNSTGGNATIQADPYYDWQQTLVSGDGADDKATWDAMAATRPLLDMNNGYLSYGSKPPLIFNGLSVTDSHITGFILVSSTSDYTFLLQNSYISLDKTGNMIYASGGLTADACVFAGNASYNVSVVNNQAGTTDLVMRNCICRDIYRLHESPANKYQRYYHDNCSINRSESSTKTLVYLFVYLDGDVKAVFNNCRIGAYTREVANNYRNPIAQRVSIQGPTTKAVIPFYGSFSKNDGSGADVNLRSGGADHVIDIFIDSSADRVGFRTQGEVSSKNFAPMVFEHKVWVSELTEKTYRYYVQSVTDALTAVQLWIEVDGPHGNIVKSDEAITARSDADDWDQYIEAALTCPEAGWVTIRGFCTVYDATNHRYIDPQIAGDFDGLYVARWVDGESVLEPVVGSGGVGGGTKSRFGELLGIKKGIL